MFWWIWGGNVLSTALASVVGAYLAAMLPSLGAVAALAKVCGTWALVIMAFSLISAPAFNSYTGSFQVLAALNLPRGRAPQPGRRDRLIPYFGVLAVGTVVALVGYKSFVTDLGNFLDVLLTIFIPWSAIQLTDWFLVRHGNVDVPSFFTPNGVYGKVLWRGLVAYAIGLGAQWPFLSQPDYTGPLVAKLGGADISWIVGFVVAGGVYLALTRVRRPARVPAGEPERVSG